jgi:hypothetical protein
MDTFALLNNADARGPNGKRPRLSVDERNARTSARHVRSFLSGRIRSTVGYLEAKEQPDTVGGPFGPKRIVYSVTTWTGETRLPWVAVTKARTNAFGGFGTRVYFIGKDARGRVWHGSSPGVGMFARLHLNKGRKARPRPPSRAALTRALVRLLDAIEPPRGSAAVRSLPLANNLNPFSVAAFTDAARLVNGK